MDKGYTYKRTPCPECGEMLADNWYVRHMKERHPDPENAEEKAAYIWSRIKLRDEWEWITFYCHSPEHSFSDSNFYRIGTLIIHVDDMHLLEDGLKRLGWWGKDEKVEANDTHDKQVA